LKLAAWVAWNNAELTEDFPSTATSLGRSGDQLPYGSPFSGNLSVDQDFPLWGRASGLVGASVSYVDERKGVFPSIFMSFPVIRSSICARRSGTTPGL
jgi:hypothetical protein